MNSCKLKHNHFLKKISDTRENEQRKWKTQKVKMNFLFIEKPIANRIKIDNINHKNGKNKSRCHPEIERSLLYHCDPFIDSVIPKTVGQKQSEEKNDMVIKWNSEFHNYRL